MKRTLSIILFTLSCLVLIVAIAFCIYSIYDINRVLNELANTPGASGIDYMGIGWGYGLALFATSAFGLILSVISKKILHKKELEYLTIVAMIIFALLLTTSLFLFYM